MQNCFHLMLGGGGRRVLTAKADRKFVTLHKAPYKVLYCDGGWSPSIGAGMLHRYAVQ